ncbi:MAG: hypothetical protein WDW36_005591 [Sanguina aurantia]
MISAVAWLPKGAAKPMPMRVEPTAEELEELRLLHGDEEEGEDDGDGNADDGEGQDTDEEDEEIGEEVTEQGAVARAKAAAAAIKASGGGGGGRGREAAAGTSDGPSETDVLEAALKELDMDHYDDDVDGQASIVARVLGNSSRGDLGYNGGGPDGDPYITLGPTGGEADSDDEIDDFTIRPTDLVILAARTEDDVSNMEIWIYEEGDDGIGEPNVYVHHDIMLPAFPLCLAWLDCDPRGGSERANLCAVGTMDPGIEIWDLDVLDAVEPVACLGGFSKAGAESEKKKKSLKKKKSKSPALLEGSHKDAVMTLSWNSEYRNVLASGSADTTVKVWDLAKQACEHTLTHHKDKVQCVVWNPVESPVLLTGAYDKSACLVDVRTPNSEPLRWTVSQDVESLCWAPHSPTCFVVATEDGIVACFDARKGAGSAPLFRLSAHDKATCAISYCPAAPGLMATASTDKKVKLWDTITGSPLLVATQDLKAGAIFGCAFSADAPHLLAAAGDKGAVSVWDVRTCPAVASKYKALRPPASWAMEAAADDAADDAE